LTRCSHGSRNIEKTWYFLTGKTIIGIQHYLELWINIDTLTGHFVHQHSLAYAMYFLSRNPLEFNIPYLFPWLADSAHWRIYQEHAISFHTDPDTDCLLEREFSFRLQPVCLPALKPIFQHAAILTTNDFWLSHITHQVRLGS
jgi:hypothetical protein